MKNPVIINSPLWWYFWHYGAFIYGFVRFGDSLISSIVYAIVFDYLISCIWQKRITIYESHVDILYYTRLFSRQKVLHFNDINRATVALGGVDELRIWEKNSFLCIMMEIEPDKIKPALTLLFDGGVPVKIHGSLEKKLIYKPDAMDI